MSEKPLSTQSAHSDDATKRVVTREQMNARIEQLVTRRGVLAGATTIGLAGLAGLVLGGRERDDDITTALDEATRSAPPAFNFEVVVLEHG